MEACLRMPKVSFMSKLLGYKKSTHIRFNESDEEEASKEEVIGDDLESVGCDSENEAAFKDLTAKLPRLNRTQEKAASSFLESLPSSLILVQG
jgi:hypothetical protein